MCIFDVAFFLCDVLSLGGITLRDMSLLVISLLSFLFMIFRVFISFLFIHTLLPGYFSITP